MKIVFLNGVRSAESLDFALPEITVGREKDNVLELPADGVSRYHGKFFQRHDVWFVEDCHSTNGVKVNGRKISEATELAENDTVEFGDQKLKVSSLKASSPRVVFNSQTRTVRIPVPPPVTPVTPAPEPPMGAPEFKPLSNILQNGKIDIFSRTPAGGTGNADGGGMPQATGSKKRFSNRLFYTIVLCGIAVAVAAFYRVTNDLKTAPPRQTEQRRNPAALLIFYEKELIAPDNVFRFAMHLERGKVLFTIDDLKAKRRFSKKVDKVSESSIDALFSAIERSGIMKGTAPARGDSEVSHQENRRMVVGDGNQLNDIVVINNIPPKSFEDMEKSIGVFAEEFGLQTIAMTSAELEEQAQNNFIKAEDLFANRQARPSNLRDAISRYKITVDYLESFSPKKPLWYKAGKQLEIAEKLRAQKVKELNFERVRLLKFKEYDALRYVFTQLMEISDPDSEEYNSAREMLFKLDHFLNRRKR